MSVHSSRSALGVALVGNPNTGKSTLFTALAGIHQHVGNYPGVTVEKKTGWTEHQGRRYELVDLPGMYSLAPRSRDEMVAADVLLGRMPDGPRIGAIICVANACNVRRSLYLLSQLMELGLPVVLALNMADLAVRHGVEIDVEALSRRLGIPVVLIQAHRRIGIDRLMDALDQAVRCGAPPPVSLFPEGFEREVDGLEALLASQAAGNSKGVSTWPRVLVRRLLLDRGGYLEEYLEQSIPPDRAEAMRRELEAARARLAEQGCELPAAEAGLRHEWAEKIARDICREPARPKVTWSDRLDRVLTHRLLGSVLFALLMFVMFQAVFTWAEPLTELIDRATGLLAAMAGSVLPPGALRSLLVEGVIGGVGLVMSFLPQILVLFLFIAILEDCGYMARAAFLMDGWMARVGLSGKSCIPLLSSFACAVPGIMAARVIEDERDRLTTILVAPLMTCSARLPVYALLIRAFVPRREYLGGWVNLWGLTLAGLYVLGIVSAVVVALVLKRTLLRAAGTPLLLELPDFKWPSLRNVAMRVGQRGWVFVRRAGTVILAVSILIWALLNYPQNPQTAAAQKARHEQLAARLAGLPENDPQRTEIRRELARLEQATRAEVQRQSFLGHAGRLIEPAVRPLGWDWRIASAVLASFPAREIVVATLGVMYNVQSEVDVESEEGQALLRARLRAARDAQSGRPVFSLPVAFSLMVFYALCAQCAATLAVIRRETNSWRWPAFAFAYMTGLAYVAALVTYQLGAWLGG